jgi:hypothetical protein
MRFAPQWNPPYFAVAIADVFALLRETSLFYFANFASKAFALAVAFVFAVALDEENRGCQAPESNQPQKRALASGRHSSRHTPHANPTSIR